MINWYRAALRRKPRPRRDSIRVPVPTLLIWGAQDRFLGQEMVQPSIELCDNGQVERIDEATHWVQQDVPDKVNRLLEAFSPENGKTLNLITKWAILPAKSPAS